MMGFSDQYNCRRAGMFLWLLGWLTMGLKDPSFAGQRLGGDGCFDLRRASATKLKLELSSWHTAHVFQSVLEQAVTAAAVTT